MSLKIKSAAEEDAAKAETARWKVQIAQLEKTNGHVDAVWDALCGDSDHYLPPVRDTDGKILMELFGRSTKSIMKQVRAINQIVSQGEEMARGFEVLQTGKDTEIYLLAACFQNPSFISGANRPSSNCWAASRTAIFRWNRGDVFAAPTWRWIEHRASEDRVLFSITNEPLLRFAQYYKFEGG